MTHLTGEAATTHQPPATHASSLLVVDDNSMNRIMLSRYLAKLGYQELEQMKTNPHLREILVIMVSAVDELESTVRCIELGTQNYLPKPFSRVLLLASHTASLARKRLREQELDYLYQVGRVTAVAITNNDFQQKQRLGIEIDHVRKARVVADITESEYFQQLLGKADELRKRARADKEDGVLENSANKLDNKA